MSIYKVSQKLVCIDDNYPNKDCKFTIKKGDIVTVEATAFILNTWYLVLEEDRRYHPDGRYHYAEHRFAPIIERHQKAEIMADISEMYPATKETVESPVKEKV